MTHITSTSRSLNSFYLNAVLKSVSFSGLWAASRIHAFGTRHDRSNRWDPPTPPHPRLSRLPSLCALPRLPLLHHSRISIPAPAPDHVSSHHKCASLLFCLFFFSFFCEEGGCGGGVGEGDMTAMVQLLYFCNSQVKTAWWVEKGENI